MAPPVFFDARDIVGESLVYDDRRDALVWVDIGGKRIHRLRLADKSHESWPAPDFPTSIGLRKDGGAIVGLRDRVATWDFGGAFETLAVVEPDLPDNRLNEGRVGPDGPSGSAQCRTTSTPTDRLGHFAQQRRDLSRRPRRPNDGNDAARIRDHQHDGLDDGRAVPLRGHGPQ